MTAGRLQSFFAGNKDVQFVPFRCRMPLLTTLPLILLGCGFSSGPGKSQGPSIAPGHSPASTVQQESSDETRSTIHFEWIQNSGVDFRHRSGNSADRPFPAANGSGIGAIDYDLDGNYDLYFASGRSFPLDRPDSSATGCRLFRNGGNWSFHDVTLASGTGHLGYGAGVAVGDFDSDGFPDLYVTCYGPNVLYRNCGDGTFMRVEETAGVNDSRWGTSATFLDYDGDGNLDLYVCNYAKWSLETNQFCGNRETNTRIFCNPSSVEPEADLLYRSSGDGAFTESSAAAGVAGPRGRGQGVVAADVDLDGRVDLFVGNDLQPNFLFQNVGQGQFRDISDESGAAYDKAGQVHAGMGVDAADLNGDGLPELFVTNFEQEYSTCYENQGQASFVDVTETRSLAAASRPWVGWGTALVDLDSDGFRDVIVTNGHTDDNLAEMGRDALYQQPPLIWRNRGKRFELASQQAGDYFRGNYCGRALAVVDLDNDGDLDVIIGHQDQSPALLRNDGVRATALRQKTFTVRLVGRQSARDAIGTRIEVKSGAGTTFHQVRGGGSYLSAHDARIVGICEPGLTANVVIRWPSGIESAVGGVSAGREYVIVEPVSLGDSPITTEVNNRN